MTLLELLIAMSLMVMVVGMLGALAKGVQQGFEYTEGHGTATQHARVILGRISRTVREATANDQFPGVYVHATEVGAWRFPDTLIVWHPQRSAANPDGLPANPGGLPRYDELVVYRPDPSSVDRLVEMQITLAGDPREVLPIEDEDWDAVLAAIASSNDCRTVPLTALVRKCFVLNPSAEVAESRGAVRFEMQLRPSQAQWDAYQAAPQADKQDEWNALPWVQGISGLRQVWLRMELQLMTGVAAAAGNTDGAEAIPFLDSAALCYGMDR